MGKKNYETYDDGEWDDNIEVVDLPLAEDTDARPLKTVVPAWSVEPVLRWQRSFTRKRWRTLGVLCTLVLLAGILVANLHGTLTLLTNVRTTIATRFITSPPQLTERLPTPLSITPSLMIPLAEAGFSCVTSTAWSPTGLAIALLGYASGCQYDSGNAVGLVSIYDAYSAKRLLQLHPDELIKQQFYKQFPAIHDTLLFYYHEISWSPDKKNIAILFSMHTSAQIGGAAFFGLVLFDQKQQSTRVLLRQEVNVGSYQLSATSYNEWDIQHGETIATPSVQNVDPFVFSSNIPVTEKYAWGDNGAFLPQPQKTIQPSTVGNPNGDTSFTLWQSGSVEVLKQDQSGGAHFDAGIFVWVTSFTTWSPDGRYIIDGVFIAARLEPPGHPRPDRKTLVAFHMENLPILPIHDTALLSALQRLNATQKQGAFYPTNISWSLNGLLMSLATSEQKKTLYSVTSGYPVALLTSFTSKAPSGQSTNYYWDNSINWSPDSTRVLAQDAPAKSIVVWNIPAKLR